MMDQPDAQEPLIGADELRARRQRLGLSREQLAVLSDCSVHSVIRYEQGVRARNSRVLERIAVVLAEREVAPETEIAA